jgi:hypothetical protein
MGFNYTAPAVTDADIEEAQKASGPREAAPKGSYRVRLHSMRGKQYAKDGITKDLVELFFIIVGGNFKGANMTLFRCKNDPATTTNRRDVITMLKAAGLSDDEIKGTNWAIDTDVVLDERGRVAAAFVKADGSTVLVDGLEFEAFVDLDVTNPEYPKSVVKNLKQAEVIL